MCRRWLDGVQSKARNDTKTRQVREDLCENLGKGHLLLPEKPYKFAGNIHEISSETGVSISENGGDSLKTQPKLRFHVQGICNGYATLPFGKGQ